MKLSLYLTTLLISFSVHAKLLDKVVAIFNSNIITSSKIERISTNIPARKNVSPQIYNKDKYQDKDLIDLLINSLMVREKLTTIGYTVTDEQVDEQIKSTEKRLNLTRKDLLAFLNTNNLTYDEYFEVIRETIEYNIFVSRVIIPLVSVTDQQIKNTYYNKYLGNKTVSFKYSLIDYSIVQPLKPTELNLFKDAITKFHSSGVIPEQFKTVEQNQLENLSEDGLTQDLVKNLKTTDEGKFTSPVLINGTYHVFYVKKKDLVESDLFMQAKDKIKAELTDEATISITKIWFQRESAKHFIKYNI